MSFKFDLRQRVTLPGNDKVTALIIGRGEDIDSEPQYRVIWIDADAEPISASFSESEILKANKPSFETASVISVPGDAIACDGEALMLFS